MNLNELPLRWLQEALRDTSRASGPESMAAKIIRRALEKKLREKDQSKAIERRSKSGGEK